MIANNVHNELIISFNLVCLCILRLYFLGNSVAANPLTIIHCYYKIPPKSEIVCITVIREKEQNVQETINNKENTQSKIE